MIYSQIQYYLTQVIELFKKHKIKNVYVFGSVLSGKFYFLKLALLIFFANLLTAGDTTSIKKHTIYFIPSALFRDEFSFSGFTTTWANFGYDYKINKRNYIGLNCGVIIYSSKSGGSVIELPAEKVNGYLLNIEHKFILKNFFYYSTNISFENKKIYETEVISTDTAHHYYILHNSFSLTPKIGYALYFKNHIFCDFGIGFGISYITENTVGRISKINSYYSDSFGNHFGDEKKAYPSVLLQFKIGYNF
jgi:hypothetical protein